jgi:hypothetical protein
MNWDYVLMGGLGALLVWGSVHDGPKGPPLARGAYEDVES